MVMNPSYR